MEVSTSQGKLKKKLPLVVGGCAALVVVAALGWVFFGSPASKFDLKELRISRTQNGPAVENPVFAPREQIWLNAWVGNFSREGEIAHVVQDLQLFDPVGKQIMNREAIVEFRDVARADDEILLPVYVAIPEGFPIGEYKARMVFTDRVSGKTVKKEAFFTIQAETAQVPKEGPEPAGGGTEKK